MRILVADDEPRLLAAYRVCLEQDRDTDEELDAMGASLFGSSDAGADVVLMPDLDVDYVNQGDAAVAAVARAVADGRPYAVLFLDMRMPPGIDGHETARRVREIDATINIVVVTGYSDQNPQQIARVAGPLDKLYYLSKPFETAEIRQLAQALSAKWTLEEDLKRANRELEQTQIELRASAAHCHHLALHDQLTRLPNRLSFQEYLSESLASAGLAVAVMFIDLDHFKRVNDTLGHHAGDELICRISDHISSILPPSSMLARLGGDEFGVVVRSATPEQVERLAQRIVDRCSERFDILGSHVYVGASVGIAIRDSAGLDGADLLRRADLALYGAKSRGRNMVLSFRHEMDENSRIRAAIESRLRDALDNDTLSLAYQPIVVPGDDSTIGYEALLRWTDSELGEVAPTIFVPIAEESGLVVRLGEWVIRNALAECGTWERGMISINLSTRHFQCRTLVDFVIAEAARHGIEPGRIQLEITETALFDDPKGAAQTIHALRERGIRVALDDFGTGYSSLVNLRDFELDCIKIDKSFIATLGTDRQASAIVNSVTSLARSLGLNVVAEGVETAAQLQSLRLLGCEMMQGFYYSRPMSPGLLPYCAGASDMALSGAPDAEAVAEAGLDARASAA